MLVLNIPQKQHYSSQNKHKLSKTMKNLLKTSLFLFIISLSSCIIKVDNNPQPLTAYDEIRQDITLTNFDQIRTGSAFKINVVQGNNFRIIATGDRTDVNDLDFYVRNGVLNGGYRSNSRNQRYNMKVDITMPTLSAVDFSGATTAEVGNFNTNTFNAILSGASKLNLDVKTQKMNIDISGASQFNPYGNAQKISGDLSGASQLNAFGLLSDEMNVSVSGASNARVDVVKYLKVSASGASKVRYRGNPTTEISASGASIVEKD
jgi:Putative auto-transporter adhesin, head GIN domain